MALQAGSQPVSELAARSDMSLPGFMKHLRALEDAGLLRRKKTGRVVTCTLSAEPMRDAVDWLAEVRSILERPARRAGALSLSPGGNQAMAEIEQKPSLSLVRKFDVGPAKSLARAGRTRKR